MWGRARKRWLFAWVVRSQIRSPFACAADRKDQTRLCETRADTVGTELYHLTAWTAAILIQHFLTVATFGEDFGGAERLHDVFSRSNQESVPRYRPVTAFIRQTASKSELCRRCMKGMIRSDQMDGLASNTRSLSTLRPHYAPMFKRYPHCREHLWMFAASISAYSLVHLHLEHE